MEQSTMESLKESPNEIETATTATAVAKVLDKSSGYAVKETERAFTTYVSFNAGKETYALKISSVKEILKNEDITFIPHAPSNILGIIQLRGKVIPIIDLKKRLGLTESEYGSQSKIVICLIDEQMIGLKVDLVSRVLKIFDDQLETPPEKILHEKKNTVKHVAHFDKSLVIILDETKINLIEFNN